MAKNPSRSQLTSCGKRGKVLNISGFVPGMYCTEASVVPMRKCPRMCLSMIFSPVCHPQRNHEWTLNFDLDVWQGVKEWWFCHELLVHGVLQADGSAVCSAHCQVRLHGWVQKEGVTWWKGIDWALSYILHERQTLLCTGFPTNMPRDARIEFQQPREYREARYPSTATPLGHIFISHSIFRFGGQLSG